MTIPNWSKAWPLIHWDARFKSIPDDFVVDEILSFSFKENAGEHLYLQIKKRVLTTQQVVMALAKYFSVGSDSIGYAGLKDKHAVTTQWFSVYLPGKAATLDCEMLQGSQFIRASSGSAGECQVLNARWHQAKLRKGSILKNNFQIYLRGECLIPRVVEKQIKRLALSGFPNYFGDQRFGWNGNNIETAQVWFESSFSVSTEQPKRFQQGLLLSSARSFLFNHILQARVDNQSWNKPLQGDTFILQGSRKHFTEEKMSEDIIQRCESGDLHPSAVLWGRGGSALRAIAAQQEQQVLELFDCWCQMLEIKGVDSAQRALRCIPQDLNWEIIKQTDLKLSFSLASGCFATSLIRELGNIYQDSV